MLDKEGSTNIYFASVTIEGQNLTDLAVDGGQVIKLNPDLLSDSEKRTLGKLLVEIAHVRANGDEQIIPVAEDCFCLVNSLCTGPAKRIPITKEGWYIITETFPTIFAGVSYLIEMINDESNGYFIIQMPEADLNDDFR